MPSPLTPEPKNSLLKEACLFLWEIVKVVLISLAIIIPVRYFLIQPFYVKGASMEPNFHDHEYLIIDQISYRFHQPVRGQIVVFHYPRDPREYFIKRIIGLPGETVKIAGSQISITNQQHPEGSVLEESYLPRYQASIGQITKNLGADEYFVMGDNRLESLDSRVFGPIKRSSIIGRVFFRGWPLDKISVFNRAPAYGL